MDDGISEFEDANEATPSGANIIYDNLTSQKGLNLL